MQKIKVFIILMFSLIFLVLAFSCKKESAKEHDSGCAHNLKETAVGIMAYREETGNYPDSLEEMEEFLNKKFGKAESSIYCPAKSVKTKFTYHKPPKDASPDFIILECPNHPREFKFRIKNLGSFKDPTPFDPTKGPPFPDEFTREAKWWEWVLYSVGCLIYNWYTPSTYQGPDIGPVPPTHRDWPGPRKRRGEDYIT